MPLWLELLAGGFIKGENAVKIPGVSIYTSVTNVVNVWFFYCDYFLLSVVTSDVDAFRNVTLLLFALEVISYCIKSYSYSSISFSATYFRMTVAAIIARPFNIIC